MPFTRRQLIASAAAATAMCSVPPVFASSKSVKIAVGGKALYYYLPISIAESLGYFKDEGLDVEIIDFQGGLALLAGRCRRLRRCCVGRFRAHLVDASPRPSNAGICPAGQSAAVRLCSEQQNDA